MLKSKRLRSVYECDSPTLNAYDSQQLHVSDVDEQQIGDLDGSVADARTTGRFRNLIKMKMEGLGNTLSID